MGGLARICKLYGSLQVADAQGKKVLWLWDYANDKPVTSMTRKEEAASERAKWSQQSSDDQARQPITMARDGSGESE